LVFTFVMGACARDRDEVTVLGTLCSNHFTFIIIVIIAYNTAIAASAIAAAATVAAIIELL
jgi:hypothetical protein